MSGGLPPGLLRPAGGGLPEFHDDDGGPVREFGDQGEAATHRPDRPPQGREEQVAQTPASYTGAYLAPLLGVPRAKAS